MSLAALGIAVGAIAETRIQAVQPRKAPSKRTVIALRDMPSAPEPR